MVKRIWDEKGRKGIETSTMNIIYAFEQTLSNKDQHRREKPLLKEAIRSAGHPIEKIRKIRELEEKSIEPHRKK